MGPFYSPGASLLLEPQKGSGLSCGWGELAWGTGALRAPKLAPAAAGPDHSACPELRHMAAAGEQTQRVPGPGEGHPWGLTPHRGSWSRTQQSPRHTDRR